MGIPELWGVLKPAAEVRSFTALTVTEGFDNNRHGLHTINIGIDASLWLFQSQFAFTTGHSQAGESPELRVLLYRLARLLRAPVTPLFVFDGVQRPTRKRDKNVVKTPHYLTPSLQQFITAFGFHWYTAPGEAEAELAHLNKLGVIDAVVTDDGDIFAFGGGCVIRNPHVKDDHDDVCMYTAKAIEEHPQVLLTRGGIILVALFSGGDYNPEGLPHCGIQTACGLAQCGFGDSLLEAALTLPKADLPTFLATWRKQVHQELVTNSCGYLGRKHKAVASGLDAYFPDLNILQAYATPLTSWSDGKPGPNFTTYHPQPPDVAMITMLCERAFQWGTLTGVLARFPSFLWGGVALQVLCEAARAQGLGDRDMLGLDETARISMANATSYRVGFGAAPLVNMVESGITGTRNVQPSPFTASGQAERQEPPSKPTEVAAWIPRSVVKHVLPNVVAAFELACPLQISRFNPSSPLDSILPWLPPLDNNQADPVDVGAPGPSESKPEERIAPLASTSGGNSVTHEAESHGAPGSDAVIDLTGDSDSDHSFVFRPCTVDFTEDSDGVSEYADEVNEVEMADPIIDLTSGSEDEGT